MKPDVKAAWVAALRSGRYKQGREELRRKARGGDRFCCLGVLCDIGSRKAWRRTNFGGYGPPVAWEYVDPEGNASNPFPPEGVRKRSGLRMSQMLVLSGMNDALKMTFSEIADWIESNL